MKEDPEGQVLTAFTNARTSAACVCDVLAGLSGFRCLTCVRRVQQRTKYKEALEAYENCLEAFVYALKWEKNASTKKQLDKFAKEYMERAEKIKEMLSAPVETKPKKAVAASEGDKDKSKMREAVEGAIVQDKPNVKWDDIAGLEQVRRPQPSLFLAQACGWAGGGGGCDGVGG